MTPPGKPRPGSAMPPASATDTSGGPTGSPPEPPASPVTPVRTGPLADEQLTGWDGGPDPITALREYDGAGEWELPRDIKRFVLGGSRSCDISIPGRGLSATHCLLERRANKIRLYDQDSTHGTFVRDRRIEGSADLNPGDTFAPRPITLIAMNDEMRQHRPTLVEIVGTGFPPSPDALMIEAATSSGPILITGEPGCEQEQLARAIHAMSLRRTQEIVEIARLPEDRSAQIALVKQASKAKTTVVLSLDPDGPPLDPVFSSMLWSTSYGVRVIALARTAEIARGALTEALVAQMRHVLLRPLAYRTVEIDQLLDRMLAERNATQRTADLSRTNRAALRGYDWPRNLAELRQIAEGLTAHAATGGLRPAAKLLGRPHQSLGNHFARVGLTFPLFGS